MQFQKFSDTYFIRFDRGEEIVVLLQKFCEAEKISLAEISGIGAVGELEVGLFDVATKKYFSKQFTGDFEVAPLLGSATTKGGVVYLHLHINFADREQNSRGGHLNSAVVSATFEVMLRALPGKLNRKFSEEVGLNLLDLDSSDLQN
ncbi:DNA-binding protein [Candidatus Gracilibacteria bacterium]|nr:DNA-binding protein [Candidatus Gracilibacteria bacterium]MCF7856037.1 DNA-binding protein [Candidatus Gracilibacteria bacterium]MCF7896408.1 DNA-binding protein [Candidatus Gracilibacteria bacterium]